MPKKKEIIIIPSENRKKVEKISEKKVDIIPLNKYVFGTIKFYNKAKGFGFIVVNNQDIFFHASNIHINEARLTTLLKKIDLDVYCKIIEGKKGLEAVEIYQKADNYLTDGYSSGIHTYLLNEEGKVTYFLDNALDRKEFQTFCNGTKYALKNDKFIEKNTISTTDIASLFEQGEIDSLKSFTDSNDKLEINRNGKDYKIILNNFQITKILLWQGINLKENKANQFAESVNGEILYKQGILKINEAKTKATLEIKTCVKYNEHSDYNTECRSIYYGGLYEDMFSKSSTHEDIYQTVSDSKHFEDEYVFSLNNEISELINQLLIMN